MKGSDDMRYEESLKVIKALHYIKEAKKRIPFIDVETTYELNLAEQQLMECLMADNQEDIRMYREQFQQR